LFTATDGRLLWPPLLALTEFTVSITVNVLLPGMDAEAVEP
jgi:hypothetical protein